MFLTSTKPGKCFYLETINLLQTTSNLVSGYRQHSLARGNRKEFQENQSPVPRLVADIAGIAEAMRRWYSTLTRVFLQMPFVCSTAGSGR